MGNLDVLILFQSERKLNKKRKELLSVHQTLAE